MSEEGTGSKTTDGDLLPELNLKSVAKSIAEARAWLKLRQSVGSDVRAAIRYLLEAQERLEGRGTLAEVRLDLLEAIRLIGAVETRLKDSQVDAGPVRPAESSSQPGPSPELGSELDTPPRPHFRTGADDSPARHVTPVPDVGTQVDSPPQRGTLTAMAADQLPDPGVSQDVSVPRDIPEPPGPAPVPEVDTESSSSPRERAEAAKVDSLNRRNFRRLAATYPVQLQAPYDGISNSNLTKLPIGGITLNLSRGGMLAQIDQGILRHGRYLIRFLGAGQNVRPEIMWGRVRRSRAADDGWEVGIEFDSPLEILRP